VVPLCRLALALAVAAAVCVACAVNFGLRDAGRRDLLSPARRVAEIGEAVPAGWVSARVAVLAEASVGGLRAYAVDTLGGERRELSAVDAALNGQGATDIDVRTGGAFVATGSGRMALAGDCDGRAIRVIAPRGRVLALPGGWIEVGAPTSGDRRLSWALHSTKPGIPGRRGSFDPVPLPPGEAFLAQRCAVQRSASSRMRSLYAVV